MELPDGALHTAKKIPKDLVDADQDGTVEVRWDLTKDCWMWSAARQVDSDASKLRNLTVALRQEFNRQEQFKASISTMLFGNGQGFLGAAQAVVGAIAHPVDAATAIATAAFRYGGAVIGKGTGTSDSITAKLSNGEYVITAEDVRNFGGGDSAAGVGTQGARERRIEGAEGSDGTR